MKWISAIVVAVVLAVLLPVEGRAACTITWNTNQPVSIAAGQVSGVGTYALDTGYSVQMMTMYAVNTLGGPGGSTACSFAGGSFTAEITGLPTGTYTIVVQMVARNGTMIQTVNTKPVNIPVK